MIEESTPGGVIYYIREPGGSLIARVKGTDTHYYHFDELGSTRLLTDGSGTVTDRYAYDAYGSLVTHDRCAGSIDQPYQYVGQLGYYTHHQEPEFGLLQLGVRFYDTEVGRFTQRDPVGDGINWYSYAHCNPAVYVDPSGLISMPYNPNPLDELDCLANLDYRRNQAASYLAKKSATIYKTFDVESITCAVVGLINPIAGAICELNALRKLKRDLSKLDKEVQSYKKGAIMECVSCMRKVCGNPRLCDNRGVNPGGNPWD